METATKQISSRLNARIRCKALNGHYATNHSHINYYIDLTEVKVRHKMARQAAIELSRDYQAVQVDTIICLEGAEMVGAFMAEELSKESQVAANGGAEIAVLAPELNSNNQMIFRENTQGLVTDRNVLLIVSIASTGKTINRALDCLQYYSAKLAGICALFSAIDEKNGHPIHSVFTLADLPGYQTFMPGECEMCKAKRKIDAIANSYGYSRLYG